MRKIIMLTSITVIGLLILASTVSAAGLGLFSSATDSASDDSISESVSSPTQVVPPANKPPVAIFSYTPENPTVNQIITFDATASYDPDGEIVNYDWYWTYPELVNSLWYPINASGPVFEYAFTNSPPHNGSGTYVMILAVVDDDGANDDNISYDYQTIEVRDGKTVFVSDGCSSCGGFIGSTENADLITDPGMAEPAGVNPPPSNPPCYPCAYAIIQGLSDSKDEIIDLITSYPKILDYFDPNDIGWTWDYLDAVADWILNIKPSLIGTIIENLNNYGFYPGELLATAVSDGLGAVFDYIQIGIGKFINGTIDHPILTLILSVPILGGIFTTMAGYSLLAICLGYVSSGAAEVVELPASENTMTTEDATSTETIVADTTVSQPIASGTRSL